MTAHPRSLGSPRRAPARRRSRRSRPARPDAQQRAAATPLGKRPASQSPVYPLPTASEWSQASLPQAPERLPRATDARRSRQLPFWVRLLLSIQQGSSVLAFGLACAVLVVYASTVYLQQQWSGEYEHLQALQREQRNLTAADELLKNQLASQAQHPESGLVAPSPTNTIFLPKAAESPVSAAATGSVAVQQSSLAQRPPLGY